ncbi:plastocyanin/azurin family copper-binding protein [uncultured Castellaniella sp.]|uniref:plastocyanin/azurin family copper-binding protein n=1 Tax=uncultured Castellaniella sp. TaxID=647907 RepID=UPI00260A2F94|nr:plastocyanin/azurin family copper-binding protein [uncultured Castellaniella sp.]
MKTCVFDSRRRLLLSAGGGLLLTATLPIGARAAGQEVEIAMSGTASGSEVWFRPRGLLIRPGQTVRWVNRDAGNVHTTTAYHPDNGKPRRIPEGAAGWNSDYLMPGKSFTVTFDVPGVYDYFCIPHEHAGMVGRIIVGTADAAATPYADTDARLPKAALDRFPAVADILKGAPVQ